MDNYDEQIEALLNSNYKKFRKLIHNDSEIINCDLMAWGNTGGNETSLFSYLPNIYNMCPSEIEYLTFSMKGETLIINKILKDKKCTLPDMHEIQDDTYKFTRMQLEEFSRRQRVAKQLHEEKV